MTTEQPAAEDDPPETWHSFADFARHVSAVANDMASLKASTKLIEDRQVRQTAELARQIRDLNTNATGLATRVAVLEDNRDEDDEDGALTYTSNTATIDAYRQGRRDAYNSAADIAGNTAARYGGHTNVAKALGLLRDLFGDLGTDRP